MQLGTEISFFMHSEVSEKSMDEGHGGEMELGSGQGMRLAMNMRLYRGLVYQPPVPKPRPAGSKGTSSP